MITTDLLLEIHRQCKGKNIDHVKVYVDTGYGQRELKAVTTKDGHIVLQPEVQMAEPVEDLSHPIGSYNTVKVAPFEALADCGVTSSGGHRCERTKGHNGYHESYGWHGRSQERW